MSRSERKNAIHTSIQSIFIVLEGICEVEEIAELTMALLMIKLISDTAISQGAKRDFSHPPGRHRFSFSLPENTSFYDLLTAQDLPDLGDRINQTLAAIERSNESLVGIFSWIDFNSRELAENRTSAPLKKVMQILASVEWGFSDDLDSAQESAALVSDSILGLLAQASGKRNGDAFTPPELSLLLAQLVRAEAGETVCDPNCGLGMLLLAVNREVCRRSEGKGCQLFGQEMNRRIWNMARMNLIFHGESGHRIELGDVLRHPKLLGPSFPDLQKFDVIVSNPPHVMREWGYENAEQDPYQRFHRGIPPRASAEFALISHMVRTMNPWTGRMAVIVSLGVLFRGGSERQIREQLVKENLIEAVIALPPKLFSHSNIPTAILVLRSVRREKDILFIDASRCYQAGKARNTLLKKDLDLISEAFWTKSSRTDFSTLALPDAVATNDYNLLVSRYVEPAEEIEEKIDLMALSIERSKLKAELERLEERKTDLLDALTNMNA